MSLYDSVTAAQPSSVIPAEKVYPGGLINNPLNYTGSAGPYGVPAPGGGITVPAGGNTDSQVAQNYGNATTSQAPQEQPILWAFIFTAIGVVGLAWIAHIRVRA